MPVTIAWAMPKLPKPLLSEPRLKVERANRHINDLNAHINTFRNRKPYRFVIEQQTDPEQYALVFHSKTDVPSDFALILGDAIHNLRSALDLLACDLVRQNGGEVDRYVEFPFGKDREDFESIIKNRSIKQASKEVIEILRSLKPYQGGDGEKTLYSLHDLDNADKHRLLIPVSVFTNFRDFSPNVTGVRNITIPYGEVVDPVDGAQLVNFSAPSDAKIHYNFKPPFDICFGDGQPSKGEPIVPTLKKLSSLVNSIIDIFARHFASLT